MKKKIIIPILSILFLMLSININGTPNANISKPPNLDNITIPEGTGSIIERHEGKSGVLIIHIRDNHTSPTAQLNIYKILSHLSSAYGTNLICLEGASSTIDTSFYDMFNNLDKKRETANYFLKKGVFSGAEYFAITEHNPNLMAVGVENRENHLKNIEIYKKISNDKTTFQIVDTLSRYLAKAKKEEYTADLRKVSGIIDAYHQNEINDGDYISTLANYAGFLPKGSILKYPNAKILFKEHESRKKISSAKLEPERKKLLAELIKQLPDNSKSELIKKNALFDYGKLSHKNYYIYLKSIIPDNAQYDIKYPNVLSMARSFIEIDKTDQQKLSVELDQIEEDIQLNLAANGRVRKIILYSKAVNILKDFIAMESSQKQLDYMDKHKEWFNIGEICSFTGYNNQLINLSALNEAYSFYNTAKHRDDDLYNNTLKAMAKYSQPKTVLIAGGFHSDGIIERMRKENASYIVIQPDGINQDGKTAHHKLLMGELIDIPILQKKPSKTLSILINGNTIAEDVARAVHIAFSYLYLDYSKDYPTKAVDWEIEKSIVNHYIKMYQHFSHSNVMRFSDLKNIITTVVEMRQFRNKVNELYKQIQDFDYYTAGHTNRVGAIAQYMGAALNLSVYEQELLRLGGRLHDIGKIKIGRELITSDKIYTREQRLIIEKHTLYGGEMVAKDHELWPLIPLIIYHHERPDGKGYPFKFRESQIPLLAKIMSVADVFDAITTPRRHHQAKFGQSHKHDYDAMKILDNAVKEGQLDGLLVHKFKVIYHRFLKDNESPFWLKDKAVALDEIKLYEDFFPYEGPLDSSPVEEDALDKRILHSPLIDSAL